MSGKKGVRTRRKYDAELKEEAIQMLLDGHTAESVASNLDKLREMRAILAKWIIESDDQGRFPESDAMYDSQMKQYIAAQLRNGKTESAQELQDNIKLMKQWKAEGK